MVKPSQLDLSNFKPVNLGLKRGIHDDEISINSVGINFSEANAARLGKFVNVLWSEKDKAVAVKASDASGARICKASQRSKSRYVFARPLIKLRRIKLGRYPAYWDQEHKALVANIEVEAK